MLDPSIRIEIRRREWRFIENENVSVKTYFFFSLTGILPARVLTHQLQPSRTRSWSSPFALYPAMVLLTSFRPPRATASSPPPACRAHATASLLAARALATGSSLAARAHATSPPPTRCAHSIAARWRPRALAAATSLPTPPGPEALRTRRASGGLKRAVQRAYLYHRMKLFY